MESPAIEHEKSLDDYLAASSEHNAGFRCEILGGGEEARTNRLGVSLG
jgi:hypothetical protein